MFQAKDVLWLVAHKKEVTDLDLKTFNFVMLDIPTQPNEWVIMLHSKILFELIATYLKYIIIVVQHIMKTLL